MPLSPDQRPCCRYNDSLAGYAQRGTQILLGIAQAREINAIINYTRALRRNAVLERTVDHLAGNPHNQGGGMQ